MPSWRVLPVRPSSIRLIRSHISSSPTLCHHRHPPLPIHRQFHTLPASSSLLNAPRRQFPPSTSHRCGPSRAMASDSFSAPWIDPNEEAIQEFADFMIKEGMSKDLSWEAASELVGLLGNIEGCDKAAETGLWWGPCVILRRREGAEPEWLLFRGTRYRSLEDVMKLHPDAVEDEILRCWVIPYSKDGRVEDKYPTNKRIKMGKTREEREEEEVVVVEEGDAEAGSTGNNNATSGTGDGEAVIKAFAKEFRKRGITRLADRAEKELFDLITFNTPAALDRSARLGEWWGPCVVIRHKEHGDTGGFVFFGDDSLDAVAEIAKPGTLENAVGYWIIPRITVDPYVIQIFEKALQNGEFGPMVEEYFRGLSKAFVEDGGVEEELALKAVGEAMVVSTDNYFLEHAAETGIWWGPCVIVKLRDSSEDLAGGGIISPGAVTLEEAMKDEPRASMENVIGHWIIKKSGQPPLL